MSWSAVPVCDARFPKAMDSLGSFPEFPWIQKDFCCVQDFDRVIHPSVYISFKNIEDSSVFDTVSFDAEKI